MDLLLGLGALLAVVALFRASSWLRADHDQAEHSNRLHANSTDTLLAHNLPAKPQVSFGAAMMKRRGTLIALIFIALLLPPMILLGNRGSPAATLDRGFWQSVIIGELIMAVCVTVGWFIAKRNYERNLHR